MNTSTTLPSNNLAPDEDLGEQARPGHGIPSQDPNPAAQIALGPKEAERETKSVIAGGGMVGGGAIGAAAGTLVGPESSSFEVDKATAPSPAIRPGPAGSLPTSGYFVAHTPGGQP
jgi:hypothetical protein